MDTSKTAEVAPTEVRPPTGRRTFSSAFKSEVLEEVEKCKNRLEVGALLRRRGLTSNHLLEWRLARKQGLLPAHSPKRGPTPQPHDPLEARVRELELSLTRMTLRAERAEMLITLQKKVAEIFSTTSMLPSEQP